MIDFPQITPTETSSTSVLSIDDLIKGENVVTDPSIEDLRERALVAKECQETRDHALAKVSPPNSRGRSPGNTFIVQGACQETIDWTSSSNKPLTPESFDKILREATEVLGRKKELYVINCVVGADPRYSMPVRIITDQALTGLFANNMFWPAPEDMDQSCFNNETFTLVVLPNDKLSSNHNFPDNKVRDMVVATDFDRRFGVIMGNEYLGSVKKLIFTAMNHKLPQKGILPLHCGAYKNSEGETTLMLGLSGTGKTTLSMDKERELIGDDEHGWGSDGIFNLEAGVYAKLLRLIREKEPLIWDAICGTREDVRRTIIENVKMDEEGGLDFNDTTLTENARGSFPLSALGVEKSETVGDHPKTMVMLTADASGVLPPISRLTPEQAMLWFAMGYTSKTPGTETGITEPKTTFSRFFGEPFMPDKPEVYTRMLAKKLREHNTKVFLINTGWTGGPYGEGHRIDIDHTRAMLRAAETGQLDNVEFVNDEKFHIERPLKCPGVPDEILNPKNTWKDGNAYDTKADELAKAFSTHFDKTYGNMGFDSEVTAACPGK